MDDETNLKKEKRLKRLKINVPTFPDEDDDLIKNLLHIDTPE